MGVNSKLVWKIPIETRARVLFEYLSRGNTMTWIEREVDGIEINNGWVPWHIIHHYGFVKEDRGNFPNLSSEIIVFYLSDES